MDYKTEGKVYKQDNISIYNDDCMNILKQTPDNYYDLCICDPPYGIGIDGQKEDITKKGTQKRKGHVFKGWDNAIPKKEYFEELRRVIKDQIIWGGNYFTEFLAPVKGWVFWYKGQQGLTMSDGEMAWTSLKKVTRMVNIHRTHLWQEKPNHPTQKPIKLYNWIYKNYAQEGQKILDTHLGSGSNAISAHYAKMGEFVGCELDEDYYKASIERIYKETRQQELF
jgi:site-specific DNA-methyltransferase (adenine-specific)